MSPARSGRPSFWSSGGTVLGRAGALTPERSMRLFRFFGREALICGDAGDKGGAIYCVRVALELAAAIVAADDWRCAAGGETRAASPLGALRALTRDLRSKAVWLTNP